MDKLGVRERGQLKSLLAGETLPTDAQHSIINVLRTDLPDFFSQLTSGLEKTKSGNNSEVAKYLKLNTGKTRLILKQQRLAFLTQQEQDELGSALEKSLAEKGVIYQQGQEGGTIEQAPTGNSGGGMPNINMPSAPPISSMPRRTYTVQHAPEAPKPEIHIANKSGVVAEKPPTEFHVTDKAGNIQATYSKEPLPTAAQPKLVIANSSGAIKEPLTKNPTIHVANKSGNITKTYNIQAPARLSAIKNKIGAGIERANPFLKRAGNGLVNGLTNIANPGGMMGGTGAGSRSIFGRFGKGTGGGGRVSSLSKNVKDKKWLLFLLGLIGFMMLTGILAISGTTPTGEASPISTPAPVSDISSCKFTRSGSSVVVKSSTLLGWMSSAAATAGIPASVLASVAMHENQDFVANADNNHDAIKANQYCIKGLIFCEKSGHVLHSKDTEDDPCTPDEIANGAKTAQAVGLMQNLDIYNVGKDLCSITESLAIAATKLKSDGLTAQPTKNQVTHAVNNYYNGCNYGSGYSYCDEVWQDVQNCQTNTQPAPGVATDCPITGGSAQITCGSKDTPLADYRTGTLCGHCGLNYTNQCVTNPDGTKTCVCNYPGTPFAIDVAGSDNQPVYLPKISGNKVDWHYVGEEVKTEAIQMYTGSTDIGGSHQNYYLQFHHTLPGSGNPSANQSGDVGGKIYPGEGHVHIQIGSNGDNPGTTNWLDAAQYFCKS